MRRQLTVREWLLIAVLGIILLVAGYISLFYIPMTSERDRCISEAESCRLEMEALQTRVDDKHRMERELDEIFAANPNPLSIAPYDNLQPVMHELNGTLSTAREYSLNFGTVDATQTVVRRQIAMNFTTDSYASAKEVLRKLHDSAYRCMLDNINISIGRGDGTVDLISLSYGMDVESGVNVSGTIVFFEYQEKPPAPAGTTAAPEETGEEK